MFEKTLTLDDASGPVGSRVTMAGAARGTGVEMAPPKNTTIGRAVPFAKAVIVEMVGPNSVPVAVAVDKGDVSCGVLVCVVLLPDLLISSEVVTEVETRREVPVAVPFAAEICVLVEFDSVPPLPRLLVKELSYPDGVNVGELLSSGERAQL